MKVKNESEVTHSVVSDNFVFFYKMLFGIIVDTFSREYFILVTLCSEIDFLKVDKPSFRKNPETSFNLYEIFKTFDDELNPF